MLGIRKTARNVVIEWAFLILRNRLFVKLVPFSKPPLLVLSYPRSGSSWVGKVLSTSPGAAYLREPITQQYLFKHGGKFAIVDVDNNPPALSIYRQLGDEVFRGIPPVHPHVINNWKDYSYSARKTKRLLIKEVNPRAVKFYCDQYRPKVLLLVRHPAAIALSFYHLGWLESPDAQMETNNHDTSVWEKFGYTYGTVMHNAIQTLRERGNHEIVVYRHIAEDPYNRFKDLFHALDLEMPDNYDGVIKKYCYSTKDTDNKGEIERTSRNMVFKWRNELSNQQVADLQTGYLRSKLEYFRDPMDWQPADGGAYS